MRKVRRRNPGKWLAICFPYGIYLMWQRSCRWHGALKCFVTAAFACLVAAILIIPAPKSHTPSTRVTLVGTEPDAQIFGPEAPAGYDYSAYAVAEGGADLIAPDVVDDTVYVYVSATRGSTYYHTAKCKYAYASSPHVSLYEAYKLGYTTPCGLCNPPLYDPETDTTTENPGTAAAQ